MSWRWAERSGLTTMRLLTTCLSPLCRCWTIFCLIRCIRCKNPLFARWKSCFYLLPENCDHSLSPHSVKVTCWLAACLVKGFWLFDSKAMLLFLHLFHTLFVINWNMGFCARYCGQWPLKHCTYLINVKSCIKSCLGCILSRWECRTPWHVMTCIMYITTYETVSENMGRGGGRMHWFHTLFCSRGGPIDVPKLY